VIFNALALKLIQVSACKWYSLFFILFFPSTNVLQLGFHVLMVFILCCVFSYSSPEDNASCSSTSMGMAG
jgi:hypothetical protein